ncbi:hypothetical protein AB5I41_12760 [Sphingomonas sp. MMS24-JH45]
MRRRYRCRQRRPVAARLRDRGERGEHGGAAAQPRLCESGLWRAGDDRHAGRSLQRSSPRRRPAGTPPYSSGQHHGAPARVRGDGEPPRRIGDTPCWR